MSQSTVSISAIGIGDNTIVAAVAGLKVRLLEWYLTAAGAVVVKWKDGAGTDLTGPMSLVAGGALVVPPPFGQPQQGWHSTSPGNALILNLSAAVQVSGGAIVAQW